MILSFHWRMAFSRVSHSLTIIRASSTPEELANRENHFLVLSERGHTRAARSRSCAHFGNSSPSNRMVLRFSYELCIAILDGLILSEISDFKTELPWCPLCGNA